MSIIGSAVGAALSVGSAIIGGLKASEAMNKVKDNIDGQKIKNQSWYDRRYNEDATQRADAQRILTIVNENVKQRNRQAAGAQAVMGGTEESVAAAKAANNAAIAETASQIAAAGDRRKDAIESQYMARDAQLDEQLNNMEVGKANAISQAVQGVAKAGSNIAGLF